LLLFIQHQILIIIVIVHEVLGYGCWLLTTGTAIDLQLSYVLHLHGNIWLVMLILWYNLDLFNLILSCHATLIYKRLLNIGTANVSCGSSGRW
jgi:hypothetical protein